MVMACGMSWVMRHALTLAVGFLHVWSSRVDSNVAPAKNVPQKLDEIWLFVIYLCLLCWQVPSLKQKLKEMTDAATKGQQIPRRS